MNQEYEDLLKTITSSNELSEEEVRIAADNMIAIVANNKEVNTSLIGSIEHIYQTADEMIKIRAVEIALKLLDYTLYDNNKTLADLIFQFISKNLIQATEKIQTPLIIQYSWAPRKHPSALEIVDKYEALIQDFMKNKQFLALYKEINHMNLHKKS